MLYEDLPLLSNQFIVVKLLVELKDIVEGNRPISVQPTETI